MKKFKSLIILLNLLILLVYFNRSIVAKEKLLENGRLVLLELVPVDPRSLMQGDYMRLRYKISEQLNIDSMPKRGFCVVVLDENSRAGKWRFQESLSPLSPDEFPIKYMATDHWNIQIGAESFFFQEGQGEKYEKAKFGGIKVDANGNSLLMGLYDEQFQIIQ